MDKDHDRNPKRYELIIFDWEGTLGDTVGQALYRIAVETGKSVLGDEPHHQDTFRFHLQHADKGFFPNWSDDQIEEFCLRKSILGGSEPSEMYLLPGAKELIECLSQAGINLAIASNKGQQALQAALQRSALQSFFHVIRSAGQTPPKPCPQMLTEILAEFLLTPADALMIGDSVSDVEMAKRIGMDAVGFDYYHQNTQALIDAGALFVFDNYSNVAQFLNLLH